MRRDYTWTCSARYAVTSMLRLWSLHGYPSASPSFVLVGASASLPVINWRFAAPEYDWKAKDRRGNNSLLDALRVKHLQISSLLCRWCAASISNISRICDVSVTYTVHLFILAFCFGGSGARQLRGSKFSSYSVVSWSGHNLSTAAPPRVCIVFSVIFTQPHAADGECLLPACTASIGYHWCQQVPYPSMTYTINLRHGCPSCLFSSAVY